MEEQVSIQDLYNKLKRLENALEKKGIIEKEDIDTYLISKDSLAEDWLSPEDEEAWKDL